MNVLEKDTVNSIFFFPLGSELLSSDGYPYLALNLIVTENAELAT